MKKIQQISLVFETMPLAAQIFVGATLLIFAAASVYSRINLDFGEKAFTGFPRERLRTDKIHLIAYTGIPVVLALGFFGLLAVYHFGR